jgi:TRAP-type mannitol/chloroaromatic compound transport system permease large subunit
MVLLVLLELLVLVPMVLLVLLVLGAGATGATGPGGSVTIGTNAADVLSAAAGEITADDAAADKIVFWDDSASKLTYLTVGSNLTITDTTIAASGGGSATVDPVIAGMIF